MEISREGRHVFIGEQGQLPAGFTFPFVDEQVVDVNYIFSDVSLRGQGIRDALMKEATAVIRKKCWKCMAFSLYAPIWMKKHEKEQDIWMEEEPR